MENQQIKPPSNLDSFENSFLFSLQKEEGISAEEEKEKIKKLQQEVEYLLARYSTFSVNIVRVTDGLINPTEYLKNLTKIIANKSSDTRFGKLLDIFAGDVSELEKYLLIEGKLFRYGLKKRPLMIGGVPLGFISESAKAHPKFKFGTIDYPLALSNQQVGDYELIPLFIDRATIKWCAPEVKKALEIGIELPTSEITYQQAITLVQQMKAAISKLPSALQKHWQSMINRVVSAFGASFEELI